MVPRSTTHFSFPLFFHPVKSFPLNSGTHALLGGTCAAIAPARNTAAARIAPILLTGKAPLLFLKKRRVWAEETYHSFGGEPSCFLPLLQALAIGRFDSQPPIGFPGDQIANAQFCQILLVTLIDLLQREVGIIHL